jgi:hypothetical protein
MKFFTEMFYDTKLGVIEFHFERMGNSSTTGYHVAVSSGTDNAYDFLMRENEVEWKIVESPKIPGWIVEYESLLSDSIKAHLTRSAVFN